MWFKTRVGFSQATAPFEIRAFQASKSDSWCLGIQLKTWPDFERSSLFRRVRTKGSWLVLAFFTPGPNLQRELAEAFEAIEAAIRSNQPICDLSRMGSEGAWGPAWNQIKWS